MRSILGGAVPTGERLFKAGLRKTALCPFCLKGDVETTKHMWWECAATEECRKDVKKKFHKKILTRCQKSPKAVESFLTIQNWMNGSQGWQGMAKMKKKRGLREKKMIAAIFHRTLTGSSKSQEMVRVQVGKET